MPLLFNSLLIQAQIKPEAVRLLRHGHDETADIGRHPYELWRDRPGDFDFYQSAQLPSHRSHLKGEYWATFVIDSTANTLLAGFYRAQYIGLNEIDQIRPHNDGIDRVGTTDLYELTADDRLHDLKGRLIVDWGSGTRAWIQRADNQNKKILQIREAFREDDFPGFAQFIEPLSRIEQLPATWTAILKSTQGVYLLSCSKTREQYIGSAAGADGFWGRWMSYARDGHGGNVVLKSRNSKDYQVTILEVAGSAQNSDAILAMEALWKRKLQSRETGMNRN